MDNLYKKAKFFDNKILSNYSSQILLTPTLPLVDIVATETNLTFDKNNNNNNKNKRNLEIYEQSYYYPGDIGPGRGFGNLNISNEIRQGEQTRSETKLYKQNKEAEEMFDYQYQYLNKNYQDPTPIVMPIPRGGISTRKTNNIINHSESTSQPITFTY